MKTITVLLIIIGFNFYSLQTSVTQKTDSEIICNYIKDSLMNYRPLTIESKGTVPWLKTYMSKSYACALDYDGSGNMSYALLLKGSTNKKLFLFCFSINDTIVKYCKIDSFNIANIKNPEVELSVYPKGIWESFDKEVQVKYDGILVENLYESLSFAYYFKNGKFIKFLFD